jgi:hypothetical protein
MTTFVHCRGCGTQIHETASTCPKCGAPQLPPATAQASANRGTAEALLPTSYAEVAWYRKRWALILIALVCVPATALLMWTGNTYYLSRQTVKTFPKSVKLVITGFAVLWLMAVASEEEAFMTFTGFCVIGMAVGLLLRK